MLKYLFLLLPLWSAGQITSYTAAQTGAGNAEVYWPEGATHVVVFIPGKDERVTKGQMYSHGSPIKKVLDGWRPTFAVAAIQPGAYNSTSWQRMIKMINWLHNTYPVKSYSMTGLSYGAADIFEYVKKAPSVDFKKPYAVVPMSITTDANCNSGAVLCGTDTLYKSIKTWGICGNINESHLVKMRRFIQLLIKATYPARWTEYAAGHCCWEQFYNPNWKENGTSIYDFMVPTETAPPITISAGPDLTITFPVDSTPIRVTGVPEGANVYAKKDSGAGILEGMILKNLYKGTAKVTVYVEYQGRTYTDQLYVTALYDPYATLTVLDIGDATDPKKRLKLAIDVSGRLSWLLQ